MEKDTRLDEWFLYESYKLIVPIYDYESTCMMLWFVTVILFTHHKSLPQCPSHRSGFDSCKIQPDILHNSNCWKLIHDLIFHKCYQQKWFVPWYRCDFDVVSVECILTMDSSPEPLQVNLMKLINFLDKPPVPSTMKTLSVSSLFNGSLAVPTMQSPVSLTNTIALQEQGSLCLRLAQCAAQETTLEIVVEGWRPTVHDWEETEVSSNLKIRWCWSIRFWNSQACRRTWFSRFVPLPPCWSKSLGMR